MVLVPLPQWLAGGVDESLKPSVLAIGMVVIVYAAINWPYVFSRYVKARGEHWR